MKSFYADTPGKRLRWRVGYVDTRTLNARFDSVENGIETLYITRTIALKPNSILTHKLSWREKNFRGLWESTKRRMKMSGENFVNGLHAVQEVVTDWRSTYEAAGRLEPAIDPLRERVNEEIEEFIEEVELDPTVMLVQSFAGVDDVRASIESVVEFYGERRKELKAKLGELLLELEKNLGPEVGITSADINNWVDRTGD
ncbi:unnamed protein product, partial [Notodromas monacha]